MNLEQLRRKPNNKFKYIVKYLNNNCKTLGQIVKPFLYVHLWLVDFPDKHCSCGHKRAIRHIPFKICRIIY